MAGPPAHALAQRTLELVDVASESRAEAELAALVEASVPLERVYHREETMLFAAPARAKPRVVLAGHLDTVPAQQNIPGRIERDVVHGLGASDMKGGLAVMIELARWVGGERPDLRYALDFLFFPREEIAVAESPLPELFDTGALDGADLVIVLEPTDNEIHAGCLGNVSFNVAFDGISAHSARPWTGVNAIAVAIGALAPLVDVAPLDVEVGGLVFREVVTATRISGGIAENVVPDRVVCTFNYRYAPNRAPSDALARVEELAGGAGTLEILSVAPAAGVAVENEHVRRLRELGDLVVAAKQAWTPVAQFSERGLDAINFGPGATRYAHKRDEQVEVGALVRSFEALQRFVAG